MYIKKFVWANQRVKVYFISHKVLFRCEEYILYKFVDIAYETSKLIVMHELILMLKVLTFLHIPCQDCKQYDAAGFF